MAEIFYVGLGGFIGSVSRYLVGGWVYRFSNEHWFPFGTLTVNIVGSLMIGLVGGILEARGGNNDLIRLFLVVGLLGGFTTFSSFSHETLALMRSSQFSAAFLNVFVQVNLCLLAAWGGHCLSKILS